MSYPCQSSRIWEAGLAWNKQTTKNDRILTLLEHLYNILNAHAHTIRFDLSSKMPVPLPGNTCSTLAYQSQQLTLSYHAISNLFHQNIISSHSCF